MSNKTENDYNKKIEQHHLIERWNLEQEISDKIEIEKQKQFKQKILVFQNQNEIEQAKKHTLLLEEKEKDKQMVEDILAKEKYLDNLELQRKAKEKKEALELLSSHEARKQ